MKKILLLCLFALTPSFALAHTYAQETISLTIDTKTDLSEYRQCEGDPACLAVRADIIEALRELIAELLERVEELQEEETQVTELSDTKDGTYRVKSDGTLSGVAVDNVPAIAMEIWDDFREVAPLEYITQYVRNYRVYFDEDDVYSAYVENDGRDEWLLGVNLANSSNVNTKEHKQLVETLAHEFAHILTLNYEEQIDTGVSKRRCGTFYDIGGCAYANSYLYPFVRDFWSEDDFDHSDDVQDEDDTDEQEDLSIDYYQENKDRFVTAYATTEPAEDIAETFASFVLEEKPQDDDELVDEKLLYFYDFPELVTIRTNIRNSFNDLFNF